MKISALIKDMCRTVFDKDVLSHLRYLLFIVDEFRLYIGNIPCLIFTSQL